MKNSPTKSKRPPRINSAFRAPHSALLGAHMSIGGGVHRAIERARSIGCRAMQIFVKNNMQWFARPFAPNEIKAFLDHPQRPELEAVFAHANYLINLAATNPKVHTNSLRALSAELTRADQLELPFIVLHPGAHLGAGKEAGLKKIIKSIDQVFREIPKVKTRLALETTAGQGTSLGHTFEELVYILARVRETERMGICLDTAHVFAAGYDLTSAAGTRKMLREVVLAVGLENILALHLNDSKTACGSRVDRHEHIGKGQIGLEAFRVIMRDRRFRKIPKVLETPKGKELREDVENMATLCAL